MQAVHDQLGKSLLSEVLARAGEAQTEVEVPSTLQKIDVYAVPDPAREAQRAELGLVGELGARPSLFEPYWNTPGVTQLQSCQRKQLSWHHELKRRAREEARLPPAQDDEDEAQLPPFPAVVLISPGRPETVLRKYEFRETRPGVHEAASGFQITIVVLSALPRTRDTLILRLLGKGRVFEEAEADLAALPADAWEQSVAMPVLVYFQLVSPEEAPMDAHVEAWWQDHQRQQTEKEAKARQEGIDEGRQEGIDKGRQEGMRRVVLGQLRARFGQLPETAVGRINTAALPELEVWAGRVLDAKTLRDVLGSDA